MTAVDSTHTQSPRTLVSHSTQPRSASLALAEGGTPAHAHSTQQRQLPPSASRTVDLSLAHAAAKAIYENVGVDFARIAAVILLVNSELARAARDARVSQITALAKKLHDVAAEIRKSAEFALIGGVVSGSINIFAASVNIGGGLFGAHVASRATPGAAAGKSGAATSKSGAATADTPPDAPAAQPGASPPPEPMAATTGAPPSGAPAPSPGTAGAATRGATRTGTPSPPDAPAATPTGQPAQNPQPTNTPDPGAATAADAPDQAAQNRVIDAAQDGQPDGSPDGGPEAASVGDGKGQNYNIAMAQKYSAQAQGVALVTQGLSQVISSVAEVIRANLEYQSRVTDSYVKEKEANAERLRAYMESVKTFSDTMQKGAHDMLQTHQQMQDAIYQTSRSVWSRA